MEIFESIVMALAAIGSFLIGFKLLSDNMEKLFGNALKRLFNKTSDKKWVGVGMGAVTTAVVQSSGVTTVMVVGFVNAGIMSLYQAASVIMGANIGTTITAQIAALNDLPVNHIFILLLTLGVFMDLFSKNDKIKSGGLALAGLGMVFFGLEIMKAHMNVLKELVNLQGFLSTMSNPFLLLIFGIVFTALMQSSSAVTTIIISMASAGLIVGGGGNAVLYIILGSNIGSCVTALISSVGTSANARRASIIHLLFNACGCILFMILLLCWRGFFESTFGAWFDEPSTQIAMFHTFFNVVCTLLFLPFTRALVKAATFLVLDKKVKEGTNSEIIYMDKRFLKTPSVAIGQLNKEVFRMADMAMDSVKTAFDGFVARDLEAVDRVLNGNERIMHLGEQISDFLVQVSACDIPVAEERTVSALHANVGDVARIAELADNLTKYTKRAVKDNLNFSEGIIEKIGEMHALLHRQYETVKTLSLEKRYDLLAESDRLEEEIDGMRKELVAEHILRLSQGKCRPENNTVFINLVSNLERIGDHLNFVAHSVEEK